MKFVIYKSAINLSGHWTNRVSILRGGFSNGTASLFCQFDFGALKMDLRLGLLGSSNLGLSSPVHENSRGFWEMA